jgi:hypothetical protein
MRRAKKAAIVVGAGLGVSGIVLLARYLTESPRVIQGAVLTADLDPAKQLPLADAHVTLHEGGSSQSVKADDSGFFHFTLGRQINPGQLLMLHITHSEYQPLDLPVPTEDRLYLARLASIRRSEPAAAAGPETKIDNIVAHYSVNTTTTVNVGSAVKQFEVVNKGNVPCQGQRPCSPDGKWKAATGMAVLDAGKGNEFHNARASCIAGPCPFTRIDDNNFSRDSQILQVSAINWSDTATFLVEAEVFHPTISAALRQSYPVIFDRALTFTLPASAEGVSIEAQLNGQMITFPLGPALYLSWASCQMVVNKDSSRVYRCELKPGYRFSSAAAGP